MQHSTVADERLFVGVPMTPAALDDVVHVVAVESVRPGHDDVVATPLGELVAQKRARCRVVDVLFGDELVETGVDREDARRGVVINRYGEAPLAGDEPEVAPGDLLAEVRVEMARLNSRAPPEPAR